MVIDEHEVEIRARQHLAAAGFAEGDDAEGRAFQPSIAQLVLGDDPRQQRLKSAAARLLRRRPASLAFSRPSSVATERWKSSRLTKWRVTETVCSRSTAS